MARLGRRISRRLSRGRQLHLLIPLELAHVFERAVELVRRARPAGPRLGRFGLSELCLRGNFSKHLRVHLR